jgi:hypothetical protein
MPGPKLHRRNGSNWLSQQVKRNKHRERLEKADSTPDKGYAKSETPIEIKSINRFLLLIIWELLNSQAIFLPRVRHNLDSFFILFHFTFLLPMPIFQY